MRAMAPKSNQGNDQGLLDQILAFPFMNKAVQVRGDRFQRQHLLLSGQLFDRPPALATVPLILAMPLFGRREESRPRGAGLHINGKGAKENQRIEGEVRKQSSALNGQLPGESEFRLAWQCRVWSRQNRMETPMTQLPKRSH